MTKTNKTAILIINWNDYKNTKECLDSLLKNNKNSDFNIILIDNNSHDWSREKLIEDYNFQTFIPTDWTCEKKDIFKNDIWFNHYTWWNVCLVLNDNYWFTGANNFWMKFAWQHEFSNIMWLNNDTIVLEWLVQNLELWLKKYPNSLISCRIVFYPDIEYIWHIWWKLNWIWKPISNNYKEKSDKVKYPKYMESIFCSWCLMFYSRETLRKLWWQDHRYFFNLDDADYSYDAHINWIKTIIDTQTTLYHKSARSVSWKPGLAMYYWLRNLIFFRRKFFPWYKNIAIYLYVIIHALWVFVIFWLQGKKTLHFFKKTVVDVIKSKMWKFIW